jgi:hypothetical protein
MKIIHLYVKQSSSRANPLFICIHFESPYIWRPNCTLPGLPMHWHWRQYRVTNMSGALEICYVMFKMTSILLPSPPKVPHVPCRSLTTGHSFLWQHKSLVRHLLIWAAAAEQVSQYLMCCKKKDQMICVRGQEAPALPSLISLHLRPAICQITACSWGLTGEITSPL